MESKKQQNDTEDARLKEIEMRGGLGIMILAAALIIGGAWPAQICGSVLWAFGQYLWMGLKK